MSTEIKLYGVHEDFNDQEFEEMCAAKAALDKIEVEYYPEELLYYFNDFGHGSLGENALKASATRVEIPHMVGRDKKVELFFINVEDIPEGCKRIVFSREKEKKE